MKNQNRWILAWVILGFVLTGLFFSLAPDRIPVHYGASGRADRWGSKFEFLPLPCISLIFAASMVLLARWETKQGRGENEGVILGMTNCVLVLFNLLWCLFMGKAITPGTSAPASEVLPAKVLAILLSASCLPLGNRLPKARRNGIYGIRTKWSLSDDSCWQQSQRLGAYIPVACGIAGILLCALLPGAWSLWSLLALAVLAIVLCTLGSYRIWRRRQNQNHGKVDAQ